MHGVLAGSRSTAHEGPRSTAPDERVHELVRRGGPGRTARQATPSRWTPSTVCGGLARQAASSQSRPAGTRPSECSPSQLLIAHSSGARRRIHQTGQPKVEDPEAGVVILVTSTLLTMPVHDALISSPCPWRSSSSSPSPPRVFGARADGQDTVQSLSFRVLAELYK
ncbi:hypothetical protein BS78_01G481000 [Paspalum vaginatum]|nr:hypothetical protein BS78_01G481000 [Paspalum vaginatum]